MLTSCKPELVGYIAGQIKDKPQKIYNREGYIEDLLIRETFRKQGVGKRLFTALVAEFKYRHCTHIAIDTFVINKEAIDIYVHWGFWKRLVSFYKILD